MVGQVRAGAEAGVAVIPTTVVGNALGRGGSNSLPVHHDWRGAPAGNCAVYVHDSAAYAARAKKKQKPKLNQSLYLLHVNRANQNCSSFVSGIFRQVERKSCTNLLCIVVHHFINKRRVRKQLLLLSSVTSSGH